MYYVSSAALSCAGTDAKMNTPTRSTSALGKAADLILQGRARPPRPIGHMPANLQPQDVDDAMAIQGVVHERLIASGYGQLVGSKIGCTTPVMQNFLGMEHPCSGGIFDQTVRYDEGTFDFNAFLHVGVECEIAAVLSAPIRAADAPHDLARVSEKVASLSAAIEIVDDRYVDFTQRIPDWRTWIADDFFGAGVVLGEPIMKWQELDLPSLRGEMRINEFHVGSGYARDIINGHPLEALVWLANDLAHRGRDMTGGWIVMLGSVVQTKWVSAGDRVEVEIDGLGTAVARFEATGAV